MIKEKVNTVKGLVKELRGIRDKINHDIQNMNFKQEKAYLKKMRFGNNTPSSQK